MRTLWFINDGFFFKNLRCYWLFSGQRQIIWLHFWWLDRHSDYNKKALWRWMDLSKHDSWTWDVSSQTFDRQISDPLQRCQCPPINHCLRKCFGQNLWRKSLLQQNQMLRQEFLWNLGFLSTFQEGLIVNRNRNFKWLFKGWKRARKNRKIYNIIQNDGMIISLFVVL